MSVVKVIGAGLAGAEAAWQAAQAGCHVRLYEMRPSNYSPAHKSADFAELICSNSLRADGLANAVGLLKEEMRRQDFEEKEQERIYLLRLRKRRGLRIYDMGCAYKRGMPRVRADHVQEIRQRF